MIDKLKVQELIDYLAIAEGSSIHRNKTEKDVTAFYGVYRLYNKKFEGWWWLDDVANENGFADYRTNRTSMKALSKLIHKDPILWNAYQAISTMFHRRNMTKMKLNKFPSSKTALTFFSLVTNAGKKRAVKTMQRALTEIGIPTTDDGAFGPGTARNLGKVKDAEKLNKLILKHMQKFYDYLTTSNPKKYGIYAKGWKNRLKALA